MTREVEKKKNPQKRGLFMPMKLFSPSRARKNQHKKKSGRKKKIVVGKKRGGSGYTVD